MKKRFLLALATGLLVVGMGGVAQAIPTLQLDIDGGYYDTATETIVATSDVFTLYAYLYPEGTIDEDSSKAATLLDNFFISAALTPKTSAVVTGKTFIFDTTTVAVTADMTFGIPPIEEVKKDLPSHSIFPTWFSEFKFKFNDSMQTTPYNTENFLPFPTLSGSGMYYKAFVVDTTLLGNAFELHFDLYTVDTTYNNDGTVKNRTITDFAPFSHDAQSGPGTPVPEPATMLLFGTGLAGLAAVGRRRKN